MSENHKLILKKANTAVSKGNYEEFLDYCTDDTEWRFVGDRALHGKAEVRQWMLKEYLEPPKFEVQNLIAERDYLTAVGNITIRQENGDYSHYSYCDVWKFRDGKMAGLTAFVIKSDDLKE